jgi:hypothetical protein
MMQVTANVPLKLTIYTKTGIAQISLNSVQISKFFFDKFEENYREASLRQLKKIEKYQDYICMDFYLNNVLVNVVRNCEIEIREE